LRAEGEAIQGHDAGLDCFVASLLAITVSPSQFAIYWLCRMPAFCTSSPQRTISPSTNFLNSAGGGET